MLAVGLIDGHPGIADWVWLIAAVLGVLEFLRSIPRQRSSSALPPIAHISLVPVILALIAVGLLVL